MTVTYRNKVTKFLRGHARGASSGSWAGGKTMSGGYKKVLVHGHPRADNNNYVLEHILITESALGKRLPLGAEVHHFNEDKCDNSRGNLVICQDRAYHKLLHMRRRAAMACGHPDWRLCGRCKSYDSQDNMVACLVRQSRSSTVFAHSSCLKNYYRQRYLDRVAKTLTTNKTYQEVNNGKFHVQS